MRTMSKPRVPLLAAFLLLAAICGTRLLAVPADLSAPPHSFGYADRTGVFLYNLEIRDIDLVAA